jgi:hypothetical protein
MISTMQFQDLPADQRDHSADCPQCKFLADGSVKLCADAPDRVSEITRRGFTRAIALSWVATESRRGRRVCFHIAVGVPEFMTSGACATCWKPADAPAGRLF